MVTVGETRIQRPRVRVPQILPTKRLSIRIWPWWAVASKETSESPGLVVMGGDSSSEGRGFESLRRKLDGHNIFLLIFVVRIVMMFVWKDENGPFKKWDQLCQFQFASLPIWTYFGKQNNIPTKKWQYVKRKRIRLFWLVLSLFQCKRHRYRKFPLPICPKLISPSSWSQCRQQILE